MVSFLYWSFFVIPFGALVALVLLQLPCDDCIIFFLSLLDDVSCCSLSGNFLRFLRTLLEKVIFGMSTDMGKKMELNRIG